MNVALHCPERDKLLMTEFLANRGLIVTGSPETVLVCEEGYDGGPKPDAEVTIGYRHDRLRELDECLRDLTACGASADQTRQLELNKTIIMGKRGDCLEIVRIDDVFAFESVGDDTFCRVASGRLGVKPKLNELERAYADRGFIRIGKPCVVNVSYIAEVVPWFAGKILLRMDGMNDTLEVSRNYARRFKAFLGMS